jgi:hypothetical protein
VLCSALLAEARLAGISSAALHAAAARLKIAVINGRWTLPIAGDG